MTASGEISTRLKGDVSIIDIRGEVTAVSGQGIEQAYQGISAAGAAKILMMFSAECYINSGGIAVLIGIVSQARKKGQTVRMAGLTPHFQKIFAMVGLTRYAQVHPSEEAALAVFKGAG
jgi:anti-anti-sigma factor